MSTVMHYFSKERQFGLQLNLKLEKHICSLTEVYKISDRKLFLV